MKARHSEGLRIDFDHLGIFYVFRNINAQEFFLFDSM